MGVAGLTDSANGGAASGSSGAAQASARRALDAAVHESYGRMLAVLAAGTRDIALAEDCLQDAFERALRSWPADGVPDNPAGWLVVTARRRMLDRFRSAEHRNSSLEAGADGEPRREPAAPERNTSEPDEIPDRRLALLFVCAHPAIDPTARTPLMLQTVLGLDAERIARAFAVPAPTMAQRLVRAKRRIKETGIPFSEPNTDALAERLPAVLEAIYGAYAIDWPLVAGTTERGGAAANGSGPGALGDSLSAEVLALAEIAAQLLPREPEVLGLAALLCLSLARASARLDDRGRFVPIDEQDVDRWDASLIARGERHLLTASRLVIDDRGQLRTVGRFQLEAAIQSAHDDRARTGRVDRRTLVTLHRALVAVAPTLGARVALAASIAEVDGPDPGLVELDAIDDPGVARFQPAWATRAHLLAAASRRDEADAAYQRAIDLTVDPVLRAHLERRRSELGGGSTCMDVLAGALRLAVEELGEHAAGIPANAPDALHQARTRVRIVRSILSVYRSVFDSEAARALRPPLEALGTVLGQARDAEVRAEALRERWETSPDPELCLALGGLVTEAERRAEECRMLVVGYLGSSRADEDVRLVRAFAEHPEPGPDAGRGALDVVAPALTTAAGKVATAAHRAKGRDLDELHALRKAARRLRYAAEAVEGVRRTRPENGPHRSRAEAADEFAALARAAEAVQDVLGEHRDDILLARQVEAWSEGVDAPAAARLAGLARDIRHEAEQRLAGLDALVDAVARAVRAVN
ncbi:CHAD domain-containing protein [Humibacter sp.]|uniref:CHAD domain-containing protein n=1 Tax=Humibacter sp. TaxID=1940291 RepID=UPI003F7F6F68